MTPQLLPLPYVLNLELSGRCNAVCAFCNDKERAEASRYAAVPAILAALVPRPKAGKN